MSRNDAAGLTGKHSQVNMGELSLRHIPDLSDISGMGDFSESSFQIPTVAHNSEDLLLADETMGFFDNANDTLNTPALPTRLTQPPLTLAELTPRSKPMRAPVRSSLRPRPGIPTPHRQTVAGKLSAALSEELSPLRNQDPSFEIPPRRLEEDLMADDEDNFLAGESSLDRSIRVHNISPVARQLSPSPKPPSRPSETLVSPHVEPLFVDPQTSAQGGDISSVPVEPQSDRDSEITKPPFLAPPIPSGSFPGHNHTNGPDALSKKGKGKLLPKTNLGERRAKVPGSDKGKRKRVSLFLPQGFFLRVF